MFKQISEAVRAGETEYEQGRNLRREEGKGDALQRERNLTNESYKFKHITNE